MDTIEQAEMLIQYPVDMGKILSEVHVFAPATVANMVCGFDILGFALNEPGDEIIMKRVDRPGVHLVRIDGDEGKLPTDSEKNTVSACAARLLRDLGLHSKVGVEIHLIKHMPIGSGLGSSSASTVAGVFAMNMLLGNPLTKAALLPYCVEGERLACGHGHADNVAPALLGGITLIRSYDPLDIISLPVPAGLHAGIVFPHVDVPTRDARQLIRERVALKDAVVQWGNIAGLIAGLYEEDFGLIGRSMQDVLIEPSRSILIPQFAEMKQIAMAQGALSFGISGSGPSVVAMTNNPDDAYRITQSIQEHLNQQEIACNTYVSAVNNEGPRLLGQNTDSLY